ncbi:MAG: TAXI family TRAP transporter solute-binding subunit [Proteobacteria bacterium]|nr:TAXI family TRAP transporter solute-binding subunit [Pseudomonadota bacterium]MBU1612253.1 TAXI family TRAP transporter solute-binding subunit [Pseudomonadota bacterium]
MKSKLPALALTFLLLLGLVALTGCGVDNEEQGKTGIEIANQPKQKHHLAFSGGPTGGTFNFFANKISSAATRTFDYFDVSPKGSGGSADNLRALDDGSVDFGIVYSGDAHLGRNGQLPGNDHRFTEVRALAFLYGAPAQLVVRKDSGITLPAQLAGKVVAVGNEGSGAALSAERFFSFLGLWDKITIRNLGYSQAAADFSKGESDAFWVLSGYPNSAVIEAAAREPILLLALDQDGRKSGFYDALPFYSPRAIPAGTYQGQDALVATFQDVALLCASAHTPESVVYDLLSAIFSEQGLKDMAAAHRAARDMTIENGLKGVTIPLHPGAIRFWEQQGLFIPERLK